MAIATDTRGAGRSIALDISHGIYEMMQRVQNYHTYRRTVSELSKLSDSELVDLGLSRNTIRPVANEAVYGTRG